MVHHRTPCIIKEARFGSSVLPLHHRRDARMRGVGLGVALGLFRFPPPLVPLRRGHAAVLLPRSRAYLSIRVFGPERRVFHQPVLYHRPSAAEDTARPGHPRAHVAHPVRLRERAPAHLAPRPGPGVHRSERDRGAVPARRRVPPVALLHATSGLSPVVPGFRRLSLLHCPQRGGEGPPAPTTRSWSSSRRPCACASSSKMSA